MSQYYKTSDARTLEPYFSLHMMAMTKERLDIKSDIAMELAERDQRIALLEAAILEYRTFRWKPDSRGWCLPYGDEEKKLFAVLQEDKPQ